MTKFALEKYRYFPYVAWGIVISFSFFVYHITTNVAASLQEISANNTELTQQIPASVSSQAQ